MGAWPPGVESVDLHRRRREDGVQFPAWAHNILFGLVLVWGLSLLGGGEIWILELDRVDVALAAHGA